MKKYAIVRLNPKNTKKFQIKHDFENSHGNKSNDLDNVVFFGDDLENEMSYKRNLYAKDKDFSNQDLINHFTEQFDNLEKLAKADYKNTTHEQ